MVSIFIGLVTSNPYCTIKVIQGWLMGFQVISWRTKFPQLFSPCCFSFDTQLTKFPDSRHFTKFPILSDGISAFALIPSPYSRNLPLSLWWAEWWPPPQRCLSSSNPQKLEICYVYGIKQSSVREGGYNELSRWNQCNDRVCKLEEGGI